MKRLRKRISLLLVLIFLLNLNLPVFGATGYSNFTVKKAYTGFQDVPQNAWFLSGIRYAYEQDLMKGISISTFNPGGNLTVAEAVTLAVRLYEIYYTTKIVGSESSSPWYQKYVNAAISYNILNRDYFKNYTAPINRADFASLYVRLFPFAKNEIVNQVSVLNIPDIDGGTYLMEDVVTMYNYGIMTGDNTLSFKPKSFITRAEVATIISRMANPSLRKKLTLQNTITAEKHIERPYEWFVDQNSTGTYSHENCGPAVTSMILKWYSDANSVSTETLRSQILPNGGWWTTNDIEQIMNNYGIPYRKNGFNSTAQIIEEINNNRIVLVCVDGYYFSEYYDKPESGHFMIIKGYTNQNGIIRFETYNPDSRKNYYYFADNVKVAATNWWKYYYAIGN